MVNIARTSDEWQDEEEGWFKVGHIAQVRTAGDLDPDHGTYLKQLDTFQVQFTRDTVASGSRWLSQLVLGVFENSGDSVTDTQC